MGKGFSRPHYTYVQGTENVQQHVIPLGEVGDRGLGVARRQPQQETTTRVKVKSALPSTDPRAKTAWRRQAEEELAVLFLPDYVEVWAAPGTTKTTRTRKAAPAVKLAVLAVIHAVPAVKLAVLSVIQAVPAVRHTVPAVITLDDCYALLEKTEFPVPRNTDAEVLLTLGVYQHGSCAGLTLHTREYHHLLQYLNVLFKVMGAETNAYTAFIVAKKYERGMSRDLHNHDGFRTIVLNKGMKAEEFGYKGTHMAIWRWKG